MAERRIRSSPSSSKPTTAPAIAKSPWRRANSSTAKPQRPVQISRADQAIAEFTQGSLALLVDQKLDHSKGLQVRETRCLRSQMPESRGAQRPQ